MHRKVFKSTILKFLHTTDVASIFIAAVVNALAKMNQPIGIILDDLNINNPEAKTETDTTLLQCMNAILSR